MNEKNLENCVSEEHLKERGFHKRGNYMVRTIHQQEIRFINVNQDIYMLDGVYYHGRKEVEEYERDL